MQESKHRLWFALVLLGVLACSALSRQAQHRRIRFDDHASWVTTDPDSLYHMRRVERVLRDGLPVAGEDPFLSHPQGSPIPWPPYYTLVLWGLLAPWAPSDAGALQRYVETGVASLPFVFGILTTLVAALAGRALAGNAGAWIAGLYHALCAVAIAYGKLGNGDHHAWVALLAGALLWVVSLALTDGRLERPRAALGLGVAAGLLVGLLLGSWVGALMYVVGLELVLGWLIVLHARRARPGLARFGLALHGTALLALLPAVLTSPWREVQPWMVVNLSWFHPAFLLAGGLVFVPLPWLRAGSRAVRAYPWVVAGAILAAAVLFLATDLAPARALREGFSWVGRTNEFMSRVRESQSLFEGGSLVPVAETLGWAVLVLPVAWAAAALCALRRGRLELLPWVVAVFLLGLQAARQARFAESLVLPMSVVLGWGAATLLSERGPRTLRSVPPPALALLGLLLVAGAHARSTLTTFERLREGPRSPRRMEVPARLAARRMAEWIRESTPTPPDYAVLANWRWGHVLEWAADRPTVATNFGVYVGREAFRAPARFFLSEDPLEAEALLRERGARYVLLTSALPDQLNSMIQIAAPERRERWVEPDTEQGGRVRPGWFRTMGARLMFDGAVFLDDEAPPLDFLRLVYVSGLPDPERTLRTPTETSPAGWIWEHVPGARLEVHGNPGEELTVRVVLEYERAPRPVTWSARATVDADGTARLRVPYATTEPNGRGRVVQATWSLGEQRGRLEVAASDVLVGASIRLP